MLLRRNHSINTVISTNMNIWTQNLCLMWQFRLFRLVMILSFRERSRFFFFSPTSCVRPVISTTSLLLLTSASEQCWKFVWLTEWCHRIHWKRGKTYLPCCVLTCKEWTESHGVHAFTVGWLCWKVTYPIALIWPIIPQSQTHRPALKKTDIILIVWGWFYIKQPGTGVLLELKYHWH